MRKDGKSGWYICYSARYRVAFRNIACPGAETCTIDDALFGDMSHKLFGDIIQN